MKVINRINVFAVLVLASGTSCPLGKEPVPASPGHVELGVLDIRPSFDGESYEGRFRFVNHGTQPLKISGNWKPVNGKFWPTNIQYQILRNGQWEMVRTTSHGLLHPREMLPKTPYEYIVDLGAFDEQDTPLTCRIGVEWDQYWSPPFVLDWKSDRKVGKFLAAKKAHIKMLREAFLKSGFRKELLEDEQFPHHLVKSMLDRMTANGAADRWFGPYRGKLIVWTSFLPNGNVIVNFDVAADRKDHFNYSGQLQWNPNKLSRNWFQAHRRKCISASGREPGEPLEVDSHSVLMSFDSENLVDLELREREPSTCMMDIFHRKSINSLDPLPRKTEVMEAWERAVDAFEEWFAESN